MVAGGSLSKCELCSTLSRRAAAQTKRWRRCQSKRTGRRCHLAAPGGANETPTRTSPASPRSPRTRAGTCIINKAGGVRLLVLSPPRSTLSSASRVQPIFGWAAKRIPLNPRRMLCDPASSNLARKPARSIRLAGDHGTGFQSDIHEPQRINCFCAAPMLRQHGPQLAKRPPTFLGPNIQQHREFTYRVVFKM